MHRINFGQIKGIELKDNWGLLPDPMGRSRKQKWWKATRKENFWFPSYDDDAFWPTSVPGAFTRLHEKLEYYEGTVVYINKFDAPPIKTKEKFFLHFEAVNERCSVFLNGIFLGEHEGGCIPFTFEVSDVLEKENRLMLLVDAIRHDDDVPGVIHDWFHDAGIIRPVKLYSRPKKYIRDVAISTRIVGEKAELEIKVLTDTGSRDTFVPVDVEIVDPKSNKIVLNEKIECRSGSWAAIKSCLNLHDIELWSNKNPFMYELRIEMKESGDKWSDEIGLREIRTCGKDILLNGEIISLKGVAAWMEDPDRGIFSLGPERSAETIKILKDLNCNFIRAGHRPQGKDFIHACNKAGILVWQEVPVYWIKTMQKPAESRKALKMLESMICEHRNAPSIIIWSIGNESIDIYQDEEQSNLNYFIEASDFVHETDPSRLVTYTGGAEGAGGEKLVNSCPKALVEKLDIVSINSYKGIYDGAEEGRKDEFPQQYDRIRQASSWGKPVILAEAGIDAVLGEQGYDFGEKRQVAYHQKLQDLFKTLNEEGVLQGMALFVLNDFKTPIKLGRFQKGYNRKGLITEKLEAKPAYTVVKNGYAD